MSTKESSGFFQEEKKAVKLFFRDSLSYNLFIYKS